MISQVLKQLGYKYIETVRKRTVDRFVLCKGKDGYFYIKVDERQLEGYSSKSEVKVIYYDMINKQIKNSKIFKSLIELREYIAMI